jgi:hypothetical protein
MDVLRELFAGALCCFFGLALFVVPIAAVVGLLRRLRKLQQVVIGLGAWAAVVQVYYPPYVEVRGTQPHIDIDPPDIPRYPREMSLGRRPLDLTSPETPYSPHVLGVYRDTPKLFADLLATVAVTALGCALSQVLPARRSQKR